MCGGCERELDRGRNNLRPIRGWGSVFAGGLVPSRVPRRPLPLEALIRLRVAWVGGRGGVDHGWFTGGDEYYLSRVVQLFANGTPGTSNGALARDGFA